MPGTRDRVAIRALAQLIHLELWDNQIGDAGMKAFSDALAIGALAQLTHLWLMGNQIGDEGMKAFSKALTKKAMKSLEKLYMDDGPQGTALNTACKARMIEFTKY